MIYSTVQFGWPLSGFFVMVIIIIRKLYAKIIEWNIIIKITQTNCVSWPQCNSGRNKKGSILYEQKYEITHKQKYKHYHKTSETFTLHLFICKRHVPQTDIQHQRRKKNRTKGSESITIGECWHHWNEQAKCIK